MKFRYYITDPFEGVVKGTNGKAVAKNYAACSDFFVVVDSQEGVLLLESGEADDIEEIECN